MHNTTGISITSWLRACFALRECAMDSRGFAELASGDDEVIRWPRTSGDDVIAIAAVFDGSLREQPLRFGGHGLAQKWRACVDDLERCALTAPDDEYEENQTFWNALPAVCVYLHSQAALLPPPSVWDALLAQLAAPAPPQPPRNHGAHVPLPLNRKTIEDIYVSEFKWTRDKRGADRMKPEPGMTGGERWIPRATNSDVTTLARFWTWVLSQSPRIRGHEAVEQYWFAATRDIDELARGADPDAVYSKNNAFWRALQMVALQVAVAVETTHDANAVAAIAGRYLAEPRNVGPKGDGPFKHFENVQTFDDLYLEQFKYLRDLRGFDRMQPEPGMRGAERVIPRSTNADVIALGNYWADQLARVKKIDGRDAIQTMWWATLHEVDALALHADPEATYANNNGFWRALQATAIHVAVADEARTLIEIVRVSPLDLFRNVGPKGDGPFKHFDGVNTFDELYLEQWKYLKELRGSDKLRPDADPEGPERIIPRATNADVVALAGYWSKQLGSVKKVIGHDSVVTEWKGALLEIDLIARGGKPDALYLKNNAFWRTLQRTAIHIAVADEQKSETDLLIEAIKENVVNLPDNLKAAGKAVGSAVADATKTVVGTAADIAFEPIKSLFSGLGAPLLIGGAAVVGLVLLTRGGGSERVVSVEKSRGKPDRAE